LKKDFEEIKEAAKTLTKFLLKDPSNWVGVFPLNEDLKYVDKTRFCQKYQTIEAQIKGFFS